MRMLLLFYAAAISTSPLEARPAYRTKAPIAYLVDMTSGAVLFDKAADKPIPPASMAKMMTVYVVFDLLQSGTLDKSTEFMVRPETWAKWNNTGSTMFLKPGQRVTVENLLHGVVTLSGNDAAVVLAEGIAGNEAAFVERMNATARKLGMTNSKFGSATGWPDGGRTLTTALDLAQLGARTIQDFPELYRQYYGFRTFRWNGITQLNRNPILRRLSGADGIKTGHTGEAGYCFAGTAVQDGRRLIMVVAGLPDPDSRQRESLNLLNWGFKEWRSLKLYEPQSVVATLPVQLGSKTQIDVIAPKTLALSLPVQRAPRYKLFVRYSGPVKAPFKKGAELAQLVAKFDDTGEQVMPLVAAHSVAKAGFFVRALNGLKTLVGT
ncbi:MAG: D-alanyl-D-alanine carboxypeptidase [Sphingomonadaceae bacterium]|nr:D-alanyl-D-alanine carboxypeptidase [Sphingomonadaceae bacterium]